MAFSDYVFDATGVNPSNLIEAEVHAVDVTVDISVWPRQGAFYSNNGTFVLEGRLTTGDWEELKPSIDYSLSPVFLDPAARTGKLVCSYVLLIKEVTEVRFLRYQAIGEIQNEYLIAEIAMATFDRSSLFEWNKISGDVQAFNPRLRDDTLKGLSPIEVMNVGLEKILMAINSPASSTSFSAVDLTKLYQRIDAKQDSDSVASTYLLPSQPNIPMNANVATRVFSAGNAARGGSVMLAYLADSGKVHMKVVNFGIDSGVPFQTLTSDTYGEASIFTHTLELIDSDNDGSPELNIFCTATEKGTFTIKLLFQF